MHQKAQQASQTSGASQGKQIRISAIRGNARRKWHQHETGKNSLARVPVAMLRLGADAVVTDVTDRCLSLLGYQYHEVVGHHLSDFQDHVSAQQTAADWDAILIGGEINEMDCCFQQADGGLINVAMSATAQRRRWSNEVWVLVALTDTTRRKQAEAALEVSQDGLRHAQKMEAIGHLTGGIAHDFNNLIQAVRGNLELICSQRAESPIEVMRLAHNALAATQKATTLTSQLLAFARSHRADTRPIEPVKVIEEIHDLLARAAGERIVLRLDVPSETGGTCLADLNQLECALLNLVINARDAIGDAAGTISISVGMHRVEAASPEYPADGCYLRIAVRDDGPGMPEEVRRRAFEPFFTTKGMGKGSGLGLAQIQSFAQQAGGKALIESTVGQGTEVAILLPSTSQPARRVVEPPGPTGGAETGEGETILIVDDDAMVRATLAETLCDLGYEAIEAKDADAALAMLHDGIAADLIFTDLSMPGSMDGFEFALTSRKRFAEIPVILTTGHIGFLSDSPLPPGVTFVKKPFSRAEIAAALSHALDRKI